MTDFTLTVFTLHVWCVLFSVLGLEYSRLICIHATVALNMVFCSTLHIYSDTYCGNQPTHAILNWGGGGGGGGAGYF